MNVFKNRTRLLSLAIAGALAAPMGAALASSPLTHYDYSDQTIETTNNNAYGIGLSNGDTATATNVDVITHGIGSYGAYAASGSQMSIANSLISTNGNSAFAVSAVGQGTRIDIADSMISTQGTLASGVVASNQGIVSASNISIDTAGPSASGVLATDAGTAVHLSDSTIHTAGTNGADGLIAKNGALIEGSNLNISTTGRISDGVQADGANSAVHLSSSNITTDGQYSNGVYATAGGSVQIDNSSIITKGDAARGIATTGAASRVVANNVNIDTSGFQSYGVLAFPDSSVAINGGTIRTSGENGHGLTTNGTGVIDGHQLDIETTGLSSRGIAVASGGVILVDNSSIRSLGENSGAVYNIANVDTIATLNLSNSKIYSEQASAFQLAGDGTSLVNVSGSSASSGTGLLLSDVALADKSSEGNGMFDAKSSTLQGDIRIGDTYQLDAALADGTVWTGATSGMRSLALQDSTWNMSDSSSVGALGLNNSTIQFAAPVSETTGYKHLTVLGDLSGAGGVIGMHANLNDGGALSNQFTDRLLVEGNVTTTGTTYLDVTPHGAGNLTDVNKNGAIDASEGISLVQVAGESRADAFAVKGGYVAVGPWQYTLNAFGPGQTDASQNALASGDLNWDYRLGNKYVTESGPDPVDPEDGNVGPSRPAVVPQLPSYISAPTALFAYGNQTIDTLHQRLGEIRNVAPNDDQGGEIFARYISSQQRYDSSRGFTQYGYNFDQQINALQLGGSIIGWTGDKSSLRAGWALDHGTTRVTPNAVDGASQAKYDANGVSAWLTWQQDNGFYVDAIVGGQRFSGTVSTDLRGQDMAKIRANGWTASVETGYPFAVGGGWSIEPQAQIKRQSLTFQGITDDDGLITTIAPTGQTTARLGARFAKTDNAKFSPYLRADVIRTIGGAAQVNTSSEAWNMSESFNSGTAGTSYRVGGGLTSQFTKNLAVYGEVDYQRGAGGYGFRGWNGNVGVRFSF